MTIGKKIKKFCTFRGMTQKEFGLTIGLEENGADNLFQLVRTHGKTNASDDAVVRYSANDTVEGGAP